MSDQLKNMQCPSCGANLSVPPRSKEAKCEYCGATVTLPGKEKKTESEKKDKLFELAGAAFDALEYDKAEKYYYDCLELDPADWQVWMNLALLQTCKFKFELDDLSEWSNLNNKFNAYLQHGYDNAPENEQASLIDKIEDIVVDSAKSRYQFIVSLLEEDGEVNDFNEESGIFFLCCIDIIDMINEGLKYKPNSRDMLILGINISQKCLEGVRLFVLNGRDEYQQRKIILPSGVEKSDLEQAYSDFSKKLKEIDPSWQKPEIKQKSSCFIATAATGNINHPYCDILRDFRDQVLCPNKLGSVFIEKYYRYGPYLAKIIGRSKILKRLAFYLVVKPAALFSQNILRQNDFTFAGDKSLTKEGHVSIPRSLNSCNGCG